MSSGGQGRYSDDGTKKVVSKVGCRSNQMREPPEMIDHDDNGESMYLIGLKMVAITLTCQVYFGRFFQLKGRVYG